VSPRTHLLNE